VREVAPTSLRSEDVRRIQETWHRVSVEQKLSEDSQRLEEERQQLLSDRRRLAEEQQRFEEQQALARAERDALVKHRHEVEEESRKVGEAGCSADGHVVSTALGQTLTPTDGVAVVKPERHPPHPNENISKRTLLSARFKPSLHTAVTMNNPEMAKVLLWAGADRGAVNGDGLTPLGLAQKLDNNGSHKRLVAVLTGRR